MTGSLFDKPTDDAPDVETRRRQAVQLSLVPGVGPSKFQRLMDHFGSPGAILNASVLELQEVAQIGPKLARSLVTHATESAANEELKRAQTAGVSILVRGLEPYPAQLARIPDPPIVLYVRGTLLPADQLAVAIVGSRHCTTYGRRQAFRLAQSLARAGVTVISGLARGIDSEAHRGALEAGGRTIAVCATGLETIYPPEHAELALSIIEHGSLVTESPMQQQPKSGLFPQRNRIISGLSLGVVLIEAGRNSGALHTARHAMEQNREVFAVPGRIDSEASFGCLDLIRDGATLVRDANDVLSTLGPLVAPVQRTPEERVHRPAELQLSEQQRMILNLVPDEPILVDEVLRAAGIEPSRALSTLTILEMKHLVRRLPGGFIQRH